MDNSCATRFLDVYLALRTKGAVFDLFNVPSEARILYDASNMALMFAKFVVEPGRTDTVVSPLWMFLSRQEVSFEYPTD